jgi:hypothetical protein
MRSSGLTERERMDYLRDLYELLARMKWLIETMLSLSRIEADAVKFAKETVSCRELIAQSVETVSVTAELKGVEIIIKIDGEPLFIGDFHYTSEAVVNLLKNAINKRDIVVEENDKFLLLSTCYGVGTYDRSVILTRLRKSTDINIIRSDSDIKKIEKDNNILENNIRIGLAKKIIVLVIYTLITIIIYIHISSGNIIKKIRKSRQ